MVNFSFHWILYDFIDLFTDSLDEVVEPKHLAVTGSIPDFVRGCLLRNGAAVFGAIEDRTSSLPRRRYDHVFDGLAKLYRYSFHDGQGNRYQDKHIIEPT